MLDYFKKKGSPIYAGIRREAEKIDFTLNSSFSFSRRKCLFHYKKLLWLFENGADLNAHYENQTALDCLTNGRPVFEDSFSEKDLVYAKEMRAKYIELLKEHGAKTLQQLREEESLDDDYKVELDRMN